MRHSGFMLMLNRLTIIHPVDGSRAGGLGCIRYGRVRIHPFLDQLI